MCGGAVIAKCGEIIAWHWAHDVSDCDTWSEGESEWHAEWKRRFPIEWQEVIVGNHRADVKTPKCVIELQRSSIDVASIAARERHYGKIVWVVDASEFEDNVIFRDRGDYVSFRWKWPRKSWWQAKRQVYFDFDGELFQVRKVHDSVPCGGWGVWVDDETFMKRVGAFALSR